MSTAAVPVAAARRRRLRVWWALATAGALALALMSAAQAVLPGLAEDEIRDRLRPFGDAAAVRVEALPAVQLLLGRADRISVRMPEARVGVPEGGGELVERLRGIGRIDVAIGRLRAGGFTVLRDLRLAKDGDAVAAEATLPGGGTAVGSLSGLLVRPEVGPGGRLELVPRAGGDAVRAAVSASGGDIVVEPVVMGWALPAATTLLHHDRLRVDRVTARIEGGRVVVRAEGRLR